jgi:hypothetical protein
MSTTKVQRSSGQSAVAHDVAYISGNRLDDLRTGQEASPVSARTAIQ